MYFLTSVGSEVCAVHVEACPVLTLGALQKFLRKVLICQRIEQVIKLVIAAIGTECTSRSCSAFGIWAAPCSWAWMHRTVRTQQFSIFLFPKWNSSQFFLHRSKADTGNKRQTFPFLSLNIWSWSHRIYMLYLCLHFSLLIDIFLKHRRYLVCCIPWPCLLMTHLQ